jgi:hypothetical protein
MKMCRCYECGHRRPMKKLRRTSSAFMDDIMKCKDYMACHAREERLRFNRHHNGWVFLKYRPRGEHIGS